MKLRPEVQEFAEAMERKLRQNDHKGGWYDEDDEYLLNKLHDEVAELHTEVRKVASRNICREAVDVANYSMMLYNNNRSRT